MVVGNRILVGLLASILTSSVAEAEVLSGRAVEVFNSRAGQMISAATSDPTETESYVDGMKSACNGLIGDLMSARLPNAYGIQLQSFCMGANDLERAVKAKKTGRNAYCGDLDQGIKAARRMPPGAKPRPSTTRRRPSPTQQNGSSRPISLRPSAWAGDWASRIGLRA